MNRLDPIFHSTCVVNWNTGELIYHNNLPHHFPSCVGRYPKLFISCTLKRFNDGSIATDSNFDFAWRQEAHERIFEVEPIWSSNVGVFSLSPVYCSGQL